MKSHLLASVKLVSKALSTSFAVVPRLPTWAGVSTASLTVKAEDNTCHRLLEQRLLEQFRHCGKVNVVGQEKGLPATTSTHAI